MLIKPTNNSISVRVSNSINDIVDINRLSAETHDLYRIMELSSLSNIIPVSTAESIRRKLMKNNVKIMQLTNQRVFEPWTKVKGYIEKCMNIRYVPKDMLPINTEVLIFDNVVAIYQVEPEISVTVIEHANFAIQQKALFDNFWRIAKPTVVGSDGSTTIAVTIKRSPREVFDYISNLANWPQFSEFAANFERVTDDEYIAHTSQGDVRVVALFDRKHMLLDTQCILSDGEVQTIPYRVVPNKDGAELLMTNFKPRSSTKTEYEEQLHWMDVEMKKAKEILEAKTPKRAINRK